LTGTEDGALKSAPLSDEGDDAGIPLPAIGGYRVTHGSLFALWREKWILLCHGKGTEREKSALWM